MAKAIMVQGTMSNAGKSFFAAALCRILRQDGYAVCPFKSQNMALNSYVTAEGLEMGRAQVMQAEAAGIEPSVRMNPILLKPDSDTGSQVIVNGEVAGNMSAWEYYSKKQKFLPDIVKAYRSLADEYDILVIEGAGSPAEINLKQNDFVNMGMAKLADAPVLLVGDIDPGGVFAQLYGTVKLLEPDEQRRIRGFVINKFRGDLNLLKPGLLQLERLTDIPVIGTVPYLPVELDGEDSLSQRRVDYDASKEIQIAVIRYPRMSNYTDFAVFGQFPDVSVYYAGSVRDLHEPDLVILPGTKSTVSDLLWMRENGLEEAVLRLAGKGAVIFGVCGGYQMLGKEIRSPGKTGETVRGMGLLAAVTDFSPEKRRTNLTGTFGRIKGALASLSGTAFSGYEIHHGRTKYGEDAVCMSRLSDGTWDGAQHGNVYGSYIHGIFDGDGVAVRVVTALREGKGLRPRVYDMPDQSSYRQKQYDMLADGVRGSLDMGRLYDIIGISRRTPGQ